ncbi:unnamed protein product [Cuscuta epithymum]|uniref:Uncharacterized protein n=1 Tax=Cuscuta epithymum TaxID=186058 RepID=A0AAV0FIZ0_9ASTE|nr:unnamed protein product [Cuscuta epithymum]
MSKHIFDWLSIPASKHSVRQVIGRVGDSVRIEEKKWLLLHPSGRLSMTEKPESSNTKLTFKVSMRMIGTRNSLVIMVSSFLSQIIYDSSTLIDSTLEFKSILFLFGRMGAKSNDFFSFLARRQILLMAMELRSLSYWCNRGVFFLYF